MLKETNISLFLFIGTSEERSEVDDQGNTPSEDARSEIVLSLWIR